MAKGPVQSGSASHDAYEQERIRQLEKQLEDGRSAMEDMRRKLDYVLQERGLECAIGEAVGRFETMLAPLKSLAPVHDFGTLRGAVVALRRSLRRPNFDAPPTNFGEVFDGTGHPKGGTAA